MKKKKKKNTNKKKERTILRTYKISKSMFLLLLLFFFLSIFFYWFDLASILILKLFFLNAVHTHLHMNHAIATCCLLQTCMCLLHRANIIFVVVHYAMWHGRVLFCFVLFSFIYLNKKNGFQISKVSSFLFCFLFCFATTIIISHVQNLEINDAWICISS